MIDELRRWCEWYPRFGSERVHQLVLGAGWRVNFKRVHRLWKQEHLQVPGKQRKRRRLIVTGIVMAGVYSGMYAAGIQFGFCLFFTLATLMTGIVVMAVQSDAAARLRAVPSVRLQFRLLAIFVTITLVAIGCAIARLPGTWLFKTGLLWTYAICVIGILVRNYKPKAPN